MAEIDKEDITQDNTLQGVATFDHFMASVKEHLREELRAQRISNTAYSEVYIKSLSVTMEQAINFELGRQQADKQAELLGAQKLKVDEETKLVTEKIVTEQKQQDLMDCQILKCHEEIKLLQKQQEKLDAEIINLDYQNQLLAKQVIKMDSEIALAEAQVIKIGYENEILAKQVIKMDDEINLIREQVKLTAAEVNKTNAEVSLLGKQEDKLDQDILVAKQQVLKMVQEVALMTQQVQNMIEQIKKTAAETSLITQKVQTEIKQTQLIDAEIIKSTKEGLLIDQRVYTEIVQTKDDPYNNIIGEGGVMGAKIALFNQQREGYKRDAEQKAAKIFTDIWNTSRATNNLENPTPLLGEYDVRVLTPEEYTAKIKEGDYTRIKEVTPTQVASYAEEYNHLVTKRDPSVYIVTTTPERANVHIEAVLDALKAGVVS